MSIGGVGTLSWISMFTMFQKVSQWPDGRPTLEQPNLVTEVFFVIDGQLAKEREMDIKARANKESAIRGR